MQMVGFEPTPFRNRALIYRLRPLGHIYFTKHSLSRPYSFLIAILIVYLPRVAQSSPKIMALINQYWYQYRGSDNYINKEMGQLESCLKEGESRGLQAQLEKQQPTSFNVKLEPLLPEVINEVVDVHAVSQYSSLLAKLKHYNKKELTKVLVSQPLPQVHMRSLQGQVRKGGGTAPSLKDSGHLLRQDKQKRQLESLKQECARIDHLRRQLVRKSRRMQEQDGGKNHVHGHQPIFASTHRPQSASPSPTP